MECRRVLFRSTETETTMIVDYSTITIVDTRPKIYDTKSKMQRSDEFPVIEVDLKSLMKSRVCITAVFLFGSSAKCSSSFFTISGTTNERFPISVSKSEIFVILCVAR